MIVHDLLRQEVLPAQIDGQRDSDDVIYDLSQLRRYSSIEYVAGGFYDKILESAKKWNGKPFPTQDEYEWVHKRSDFWLHLQMPDRKVYRNYETNKVEGAVQIYLHIYKSAIKENVLGYTFGSRSYKMIKPLKVLNHKWEYKPEDDWNLDLEQNSKRRYVCTNCGMTGGSSLIDNTVEPTELLTCQESEIKDIII